MRICRNPLLLQSFNLFDRKSLLHKSLFSDGKNWWAVFTSFDEELKGDKSVMSTFMTDIGKLLEAALSEEEISGVIINPWNRTLMLDKTLIRIVLGDVTQ